MTEAGAISMPDALRSDHRAIATMLDDPAATAQSHEALAHREQLVMTVVRHLVAEEQYLYPAVRDYVPDGDAVAETNLADARATERHLKQLEDPDLTAGRMAAVWTEMRTLLAAHAERQEPIFAALESTCSGAELAHLGDNVLGAEQLAPTRPRTIAPSSAPVSKLTSIVEGFLDQVRDSYSHRGVEHDPDDD